MSDVAASARRASAHEPERTGEQLLANDGRAVARHWHLKLVADEEAQLARRALEPAHGEARREPVAVGANDQLAKLGFERGERWIDQEAALERPLNRVLDQRLELFVRAPR